MNHGHLLRFILYSLVMFHVISGFNITVQAEESDQQTANDIVGDIRILDEKYSSYIQNEEMNVYEGDPIILNDVSGLVEGRELISTFRSEEVIQINPAGEAEIIITAPEKALYQIGLQYFIEGEQILPSQLEVEVNGEIPFYELRNIVFESKWENPKEWSKDKYGNEIVPQPVKVDEWQTKFLIDSSYRNSDPFLIPLEEGENTLTLKLTEGNLLFKQVILQGPTELKPFEEQNVEGNEYIEIEAERHTYKNDSSIRSAGSYNFDLTPYDTSDIVLNHINADSFKTAGQKLFYEVEVNESGYYYLGAHYDQSAKPDFPVFMNIYINENIPFQEFKNYPISYTTNYTNMTFSAEDEPIPVYLEKGKNTISLELSLDPIKSTIEQVEQLSAEIQALSLELTNLVGPNVDRNRDIDIESYIPGTEELLVSWADQMKALYNEMKAFNPNAEEIGTFSSLVIAEEQLRSLAEDVDKLVVRKNELSTGTNSITAHLGNLLQEMNNNGVAIDKLYFYQNKGDISTGAGFFAKQFANIERLFTSFGDQDYTVNNVNEEHLQVWVNRPRQYIEIMQQLIDEQFTAETGVKVDLSIMPDQNKLILANAANEAPDVALGVNYALPFEIAIRGALQDLSQLEGYEEVVQVYPEGMLTPAKVQGGVYALPDTMNFWVLFYRTDILERLGLAIPETLDEVKTYLPELQRKGMNFFYPTAGMPGMKIFAGTMPIIYQNGGRFYDETIDNTLLNENGTIEGVRELTELFTIYNAPYDVPSFYQQFRDGSLPIGISDYNMYNLIVNAAPEIANQWEIALIPGKENEAGEVERWSAGGAESNIMFKDTGKTEEAWEFMKWWASTEVQVAFGNTLQTTYGKEYMWNTANIEAYNGLPWSSSHKEVILSQAEWITEVPRVPGSYMLERELSNAYNSIVLDGENLRTAIDLASKRVNRETNRKLEEFGFMKNGELLEPYYNPEVNTE
ncbi:extracellular solute-binding protein [Gracilibacillus oryzae]|uniref:Extracellular solute-binding protein n=1 Tax=Gracilibacillus oryzae TaxID=1672701 RepID=A0A7C8L1Z5_9BACI|nr:extracellular solute-binding protein [Gracilibacillus oryzae]KAB8127853.1 extracellular solute-binding protein [Gracilibacillus oryzae]